MPGLLGQHRDDLGFPQPFRDQDRRLDPGLRAEQQLVSERGVHSLVQPEGPRLEAGRVAAGLDGRDEGAGAGDHAEAHQPRRQRKGGIAWLDHHVDRAVALAGVVRRVQLGVDVAVPEVPAGGEHEDDDDRGGTGQRSCRCGASSSSAAGRSSAAGSRSRPAPRPSCRGRVLMPGNWDHRPPGTAGRLRRGTAGRRPPGSADRWRRPGSGDLLPPGTGVIGDREAGIGAPGVGARQVAGIAVVAG